MVSRLVEMNRCLLGGIPLEIVNDEPIQYGRSARGSALISISKISSVCEFEVPIANRALRWPTHAQIS